MLAISSSSKIFIYNHTIDLRKGFEGLGAIVEHILCESLTGGNYFAFINKRRDRMKVLYWDIDGFVIWYKRLEKGTFAKNAAKTGLIERRDFFMLLEGIVPKKIGKRFKFP
jgi:transposase